MSDRCYSTLVCAERDQSVFEKMGYALQDLQALSVDGNEIPGAVVVADEQADNGHYDELTALTGIPFLVCNGSCPGTYGDHLMDMVSNSHCFRWQRVAILRGPAREQLPGCAGGP